MKCINLLNLGVWSRLSMLASLIVAVQCDAGFFIFPPASNASSPQAANLTVHTSDAMIVEYSPLPYTVAVGLALNCYDSVQEALGNQTFGQDLIAGSVGPYEMTGKVEFVFPAITNVTQYCQFALFNNSIANCSWGPWGLGSMGWADLYLPLFYSAVFEVTPAPANYSDPILWLSGPNDDAATGNGTASASASASATATATTTTTVTCPPSGIPPQGTTAVTSSDVWPPMIESLVFPGATDPPTPQNVQESD